jgi:hypothetical protein
LREGAACAMLRKQVCAAYADVCWRMLTYAEAKVASRCRMCDGSHIGLLALLVQKYRY